METPTNIETVPSNLTPIQLRQLEVDTYTANIVTYTSLISKLNGNWDKDLESLKGMEPHEAAKLCPIDRIERFAELAKFEQFSHLLKTEIIERSKAQSILDHLVELDNQPKWMASL